MDEQSEPQAQNEPVVTDDVTVSPAVEENTEVVPAPDAEAEAPSKEEPKVEEEVKPRNNAQSRIKELVNEKKQLAAERDQYADLLQQGNQMQVPDNLTEEQYRALATDANYAAVKVQELERKLALKDFTTEVDSVELKYPELNPESDQYNESLAKALSGAYEKGFIEVDSKGHFIGTKKSLEEFTEEMIAPYRDAMTKGAARSKEVLDRQAGEAAVTPQTTTSSGTTDFAAKSITEMEAEIGFHKQ